MARRKAIALQPTDRFIADSHFGHATMLNKPGREFETIADHDRAIIDSWNAIVRPNHRVFHLGDFAWWRLDMARLRWLFDHLNGEKHLAAVGNHDTAEILSLPWASVSWISHFKDPVTGLKISASHHPQREWDGWYSGAVHLHGHVHGNLPNSRRSLDVGIESIGLFPQTFAEIRARLEVLPELDFRGVQTEPFVPDRGRDDEPAGDDPAPGGRK
jgi:calcineurin-like phosphoesterase family protein